jgi:hypothetical protein
MIGLLILIEDGNLTLIGMYSLVSISHLFDHFSLMTSNQLNICRKAMK